jgi:hypothetical protein
MKEFITKHGDLMIGVLSGFDRLVFRGSLRTLSHLDGMLLYLSRVQVLLKDFGSHVQAMSDRIKETTKALAKARGITEMYVPSPKSNKEAIARQIAAEQRIQEGPICILSTVEVCRSYEIRRDRETKRIHLQPAWRKCLFYYHYMIHPVFGFMNARIQTWVPFPIQICINGREWLSRQLDAARLGYVRRENSFVWLEDAQQTQQLFDQQLKASWPNLLDEIALELNPIREDMFAQFPISYYWCVYQSEWATDMLFRDADALARLYPRFVHHGLSSFASPDVMRFLGRKVPSEHHLYPRFTGEVISTLKHRPEGVRIKHSVNDNSIKLYDKQGSVLRVETTINNSRDLKVYRRKEGQHSGPKSWQRMRKGIADLHRRAQYCEAANKRYLDALAAVSDDATLAELTKDICRPIIRQGKRFRALRPWDHDDMNLFQAVTRGEFLITGFRNRDIAQLIFSTPASPKERKRICAAVSYRLRILRAHGLIAKIQQTHRYRVTKKGRRVMTALLVAQHITIEQLTKKVA